MSSFGAYQDRSLIAGFGDGGYRWQKVTCNRANQARDLYILLEPEPEKSEPTSLRRGIYLTLIGISGVWLYEENRV
jgi:hypothetical protein